MTAIAWSGLEFLAPARRTATVTIGIRRASAYSPALPAPERARQCDTTKEIAVRKFSVRLHPHFARSFVQGIARVVWQTDPSAAH